MVSYSDLKLRIANWQPEVGHPATGAGCTAGRRLKRIASFKIHQEPLRTQCAAQHHSWNITNL